MTEKVKTTKLTSPYFLSASDNPGSTFISCVLNGENYSTWARATWHALKAKNKLGFIDGTVQRLKPSDSELGVWKLTTR